MTARLIHFPAAAARARVPDGPHGEFCGHRQAMLRALVRWLREAPTASDIREEVDGTIGAIRALVDLEADHG